LTAARVPTVTAIKAAKIAMLLVVIFPSMFPNAGSL
jgi:hypothetical protein